MKQVQKIIFAIILTALFTSCQPGADAKEILSNSGTRKEIMNTIAGDSSMHKEMMTVMMNGNNGMMIEDYTSMTKMMKDNPGKMTGMMNDMMEMCRYDTVMMKTMCKTMMANPQMMDMMKKMKAGNMDNMKMNNVKGMDSMQKMDHKMQQ
jgi:hypothetical protein